MPYKLENQEDTIVGKISVDQANLYGSIYSNGNLSGHMVLPEIFKPGIPSSYGRITWNGSYLTVS